MNRIQERALAISRSTNIQPSPIVAPSLDGIESPDLSVFVPLHYEANYSYPLLVWLHGEGTDETQLRQVMPFVSLRNYVAVAPRGNSSPALAPFSVEAYGWSTKPDDLEIAEDRVFDAVHRAAELFNVAPDRVFLAGFDTGGSVALRLALSNPGRFAGVLSLGGAPPLTGRPLSDLHAARNLNVFFAYGRDSRRCRTEDVCQFLRLVHSAGLNIMLREYSCGHVLHVSMLADMNRWMMELVCQRHQLPLNAD
jgi:phospholipase/carboxylesterase